MSDSRSEIEKLLGIEFSSDPRNSRFRLPGGDVTDTTKSVGKHLVTKEMALDWVTHRIYIPDTTPRELRRPEMRPNRLISAHRVKSHWAPIFRRGEFDQDNGQDFLFTPDGYALDCQHRLAAIAYTGVEVRPGFKRNVPWGSFGNIDTPLTRTPKQFLHGYRHPAVISSAVKYILPTLESQETLQVQSARASNEEVYLTAEKFPLLKGAWVSEAKNVTLRVGIPAGPFLAHTVMAGTAGGDINHIQKFINGVLYGSDLTSRDPRYLLREKFLDIRNAKRRIGYRSSSQKPTGTDQVEQINLLRFAFNAWMEGRELERLAVGKGTTLTSVWGSDQLRAWYKEVS